MKFIASVYNKKLKCVEGEYFCNDNGSGLFQRESNGNLKQLSGTCQIQFTGKRNQASRLLKKRLWFFDAEVTINADDYKLSFKNSDFKEK